MTNLYQAKVEVSDQSERAQSRAVKDALGRVLVKVSGSDLILQHDQIKQQLKNSQSFLTSYRFDNDKGIQFLLAEFDKQRVESAILASGFSIWGARRPDSLLWIALEDIESGERRILSEAQQDPFSEMAKRTAQSRGIPLAFPLYDLTDIDALSVFDVWGQFVTSIQRASERYRADYILSARVYFRDDEANASEKREVPLNSAVEAQQDTPQWLLDYEDPQSDSLTGWIADYSLISGGNVTQQSISASTKENLASMLMTILADTLAKRYAIDLAAGREEGNVVDITMANVSNLQTYVAVSQFLQSLSVVQQVSLKQQSGTQAIYSLTLFGNVDDLKNAFKLDDKIRPTRDAFGQVSDELKFIWVP
ncbi:DUF2066 domain-containing protein [Aestuariibacter sp. AA17]|uniref:DUF2066 domain-containing protein n=1 Tax=Fluctibacter corallii TaxID=2984329 RepID=A0ABT3A5S6_9ALTE|nr:DUF2066 domain-containing protein [Aestuariibacter sp. AA17]MCV2884039.1 DUF2066 domain-containing protein [Aestuariibacter sp. AA17]